MKEENKVEATTKKMPNCIFRTFISVQKGTQKVLAKDHNCKAFCIPIFANDIERGYLFRKELHAKSDVILAGEYNQKYFRINLRNFEKNKFKKAN